MKRIFEWFIRLLSRHSNSLLINLWVPAGLASVIFACRFWPAKVAYPVGVPSAARGESLPSKSPATVQRFTGASIHCDHALSNATHREGPHARL